jgi:hypothetical protein
MTSKSFGSTIWARAKLTDAYVSGDVAIHREMWSANVVPSE